MLIGIYALHMVCFQALMYATPSHNIDNSYKSLFTCTKNTQATHNIPAAKHPAVTYYSNMMKQGNNVGSSCSHVTPVITAVYHAVTPSVLASAFHFYPNSLAQLHVADDMYKVYRFIQVFLI